MAHNSVDVDEIVKLLDQLTENGDSRIKVQMAEEPTGEVERKYHLGRCDIGSVFDCGTPIPVEDDKQEGS